MIHNNLFTSNFSKYIKISISVLVVSGIFLFICKLLDFIYVQEEDWQHILWHNYYNTDNIDNLFIGSSHVYCDVDPFILDEINGKDNFNMSSGSLTLTGSYYLLREVAAKHDLKNVYLELYYQPNTGEKGDKYSARTIKNNWRATTYMRPSFNKYQFIFEMSEPDYYMESVFPFIRYRSKLFDAEYINGVIEKKQSVDWNNYVYVNEDKNGITEYRDKGYYYTNRIYEEGSFLYETLIDFRKEGIMSENNCNMLRQIIEYCNDNDIKIHLFVAPMYVTQVLSTGNYDLYYEQISDIAGEYNVPFYDFNLCKTEYLNITHNELYMDEGHLNSDGAALFTPFLWEVFSNTPEDNEKIFCDSYSEKIELDEPHVYGVYYRMNKQNQRECVIASNTENDLEYKIILCPDNGEGYVVQEFSKNKEFLVPSDEHGVMDIRVKKVSKEEIQTLRIDY